MWNPTVFKVLGICFSTNVKNIVSLNYETKFLEIKKIFNSWSRRNLTPFGKITVIKTLALSKLTYLFMNLPDTEEDFLENLQRLMFSFVWDGKIDKIKRTSMYQQYEAGGLKMVNVKLFLSSLKITWLEKIVHDDGKITQILFALCPETQLVKQRGGEFANVLMQRLANPFWVDVFKHYKKLNDKCTVNSFDDFVSECFFYNINMCRDNKVLFLRSWAQNGIYAIGHLLCRSGFLSYVEFKRKYPHVLVNFVLYEGILRTVKNYQDRCGVKFCENYVIRDPSVWQCLSKGGSKHTYRYLIKNTDPLKFIEKWSNTLNTNIDVCTVFSTLKKTTEDTRLRWFQYRLMYRIIPTQRFLHLRKIVDSSLCTFCGKDEETIEHLFWNCEKTHNFWMTFHTWLLDNFLHCANVRLSKQLIICGYRENNTSDKIFDLFLLMAKYHIYTSKIQAVCPHFSVFLRTLKQRFTIEKYNAYLNNKDRIFNRNWGLYQKFFE
jgi:hypothetical protein